MGVYAGFQVNVDQDVSWPKFEKLATLGLPADTQALQDWNHRMRILLPLSNEWALLDALVQLLEDEFYSRKSSPNLDRGSLGYDESSISSNGTTFFSCGDYLPDDNDPVVMNISCKSHVSLIWIAEVDCSTAPLTGSVFDTSRNVSIDPRGRDPREYINTTQDLLNDVLTNIAISAISLETWWDIVSITTTRYQSTYSFANPLNLILPYSICFAAATIFAAIAIWSLSRNGTPAADGGFLQIMIATRGDTEMERLVLREKLTTVKNMSAELKALKVRYGELVGEDVLGVEGRTMGFGTVEETVSLRKRK
jgi:hypothetical protein